jgi:hypothetical protein
MQRQLFFIGLGLTALTSVVIPFYFKYATDGKEDLC